MSTKQKDNQHSVCYFIKWNEDLFKGFIYYFFSKKFHIKYNFSEHTA